MEKSKYENLKVDVPGPFLLKLRFQRFSREVLSRAEFICKIFGFLGRTFSSIGNLPKEEAALQKYAKLACIEKGNSQQFGSVYGYDEDRELVAAMGHKKEVDNNYNSLPPTHRALHKSAITICDDLIKKNDARVFLDFGVSYGYINSVLANKNPHTEFIGIDRSRFTKIYNDSIFEIKNLSFAAGDIFELLKTRTWEDGIFFTMRTLVFLPQQFVERLYAKVYHAGFKYIVGMECTGISRQTLKSYEYSSERKDSIHSRDELFIHNYPGLLNCAGFNVMNVELVKDDHPHPDFRRINFIGKRRGQDEA